MAAALAELGHTVIAFDIDRHRVNRARDLAQAMDLTDHIHLLVADAAAIPLADDTLAAAGAGEVLEHIEHDAAAVRELSRVLQPGGLLAVTVPAGADRFGPADRATGHYRRYDTRDLEELLSDGGFTVRYIRSWSFPLGRLYDWVVEQGLRSTRRGRCRRSECRSQ
jgi:ubiquinone/menaquinone biosynthesis C-methylase UbiE